jgi:glycerol dehydrogenase-like iron-containing ADH family enzyme
MPKKTTKTGIKKTPEEIKILEEFQSKNSIKTSKVSQMEDLVHNFDVKYVLDLNERLRIFYKKVGAPEMLDLLDRMTVVMRELTEIINQVKAKRISLEQWQKEIQEKLTEINEVLETMKDWEATGI